MVAGMSELGGVAWAYRMALEWSLVWQWWKRSSFRPLAKAYLLDDIVSCLLHWSHTRIVMLTTVISPAVPYTRVLSGSRAFGGSTGTSAQARPGLPHVRGRQLSDLTPSALHYYYRRHPLHSTPLHHPVYAVPMAPPTMRLGLRAFRQPQLLRQPIRSTQRRTVQTAAGTIEAPVVQESALTKFYNSPIGPKTVHFWAPIMKVWRLRQL